MTEFQELVQYTGIGIDNLPEGIETLYEKHAPQGHGKVLREEFLDNVAQRFNMPEEKAALLKKAVLSIEADMKLHKLTAFLINDLCEARYRCAVDDYRAITPTCLREFNEYYSMILLLACVEPAMERMKQRGVPEHLYHHIPFRPMEKQIRKFVEENDVRVADFPWDLNFYTCSIFLFDRFYIVPFRMGDDFIVYRNLKNRKVIALWKGGQEFRRDGQLNGVNEVFDKDGCFTTSWLETSDQIEANPVNPMGFVERWPIKLNKAEWEVALSQGDLLLGWHIPSGPGYTHQRLKHSLELAADFYHTYFPELAFNGFWSESWLYDPRLSLILPEDGNIVSMHRQFYNYPTASGDAMIWIEAFGSERMDLAKAKHETSLQRKALEYMESGGRFHTTGMILLNEEVDKIGQLPHITVEDVEEFQRTVDKHLESSTTTAKEGCISR